MIEFRSGLSGGGAMGRAREVDLDAVAVVVDNFLLKIAAKARRDNDGQ